jgi:hypothetical protein
VLALIFTGDVSADVNAFWQISISMGIFQPLSTDVGIFRRVSTEMVFFCEFKLVLVSPGKLPALVFPSDFSV